MRRAAWLAIGLAIVPTWTATAQQWNDERALALVRRATDLRARQLADSGLADYQATAHGYLAFLAQMGEGFREPPQLVKADELALQVYWRAPNLSKQRIVGRRDTTMLPTDIAYHRDHLGIVQNNFPAIIRLGEGDEVRDVPHPLSATGLLEYDFALTDSLRMLTPGRTINVYEVKVRPRDDRQARVIGALYLDRDDAQVVRMAFNFTRAAFLDKQLEDLFVVLENGLVGSRFWLPRTQEIEIRRTATWLDYPVRGIIRGRWEIDDYQLNAGIPLSRFSGPEIVQAPAEEQHAHVWPARRILDSLPPDVRATTVDEIRRVQAEARALVREQALRRVRGSALSARGISDFVRFNRNEGVSLGSGATARLGGGFAVTGRARVGLDDHAVKGQGGLTWRSGFGRSVAIFAGRELRGAGDVPERSTLVNSLAGQEYASDYTDLFRVEAFGATMTLPLGGGAWQGSLRVAHERHDSVSVRAIPATGRFAPSFPAGEFEGVRAAVVAERATAPWLAGLDLRARLELRAAPSRFAGDVELRWPFGGGGLVSRTVGAVVGGEAATPPQDLVYFGGPVTAPGYAFHSLVGQAGMSQRLELRVPVPFPSLSLGRFGRSSATVTVAPYLAAVALRGAAGAAGAAGGGGLYPSAGVAALYLFDLLRLDVARGLHGGRWSFSADVNRSFWGVL